MIQRKQTVFLSLALAAVSISFCGGKIIKESIGFVGHPMGGDSMYCSIVEYNGLIYIFYYYGMNSSQVSPNSRYPVAFKTIKVKDLQKFTATLKLSVKNGKKKKVRNALKLTQLNSRLTVHTVNQTVFLVCFTIHSLP